jgi:RNase P/RNase MRP subunit p29
MNADIFTGKRVKIVFNEDANEEPQYQKGIRGDLFETDNEFIYLKTDKGTFMIRKDRVISVREIERNDNRRQGYKT